MRILVIEATQDAADLAASQLRKPANDKTGCVVHSAVGGDEGLFLAKHGKYDLIIANAELGDMKGTRFLDYKYISRNTTPVMMVGNGENLALRVNCLAKGADDFIDENCPLVEKQARMISIVRRAWGHISNLIEIGDMTVNIAEKTVTVGEKEIQLTAQQYRLLELMTIRQGHTLTKDDCVDHMGDGEKEDPNPKIIDVLVSKLRTAFRKAGMPPIINTVHGMGIILDNPNGKPPRNVVTLDPAKLKRNKWRELLYVPTGLAA